jgi:light-regulated signal transduction histidine kinase (bacteriophytochrome)
MGDMVRAATTCADEAAVMRDRIKSLEAELQSVREGELRRMNENLLRSRADLQRFAYSVSHDLREPVRMILSFSQLLHKKYSALPDANEKDQLYMAHIRASGQRLSDMMDRLLAYSQVDSQGGEMAPVALDRALQQAWQHIESARSNPDIQLDVGKMPVICGDENQLVLVFQELLMNAVKFRSAEPVLLSVQAFEQGGGFWRIEITDNGIGILAEQCEIIFSMFKTLHHRDSYPGLGAGLTIVRRIIERHGGEIQARPGLPTGAVISFTLPDSTESLVAAVQTVT